MRQFTLLGYLKSYVKRLSLSGAAGIYPLVREANTSSPNLKEPLLLYAVAGKKTEVLLKAARGTDLYDEYEALLKRFGEDGLIEALENQSPDVPVGYHKVWMNYLNVSHRHERENRVKSTLRDQALVLQKRTHITTYQICKKLRLNNSNIAAWLRTDAGAKVSLSTAQAVVDCLELAVIEQEVTKTAK